MEGVPDLPPLLAQILAETRAKQARAKERAEKGLPPEEEEEKAKGRAGKEGGPLLLEGPKFMVATHDQPIPKELSDSEDSSDEGEPDAPPGPPDAARCRAHGPGFSGAAAGAPVSLTITCRDAAGKRVREGGAFILVMVEPTAPPGGEEPEPIQAEVKDHGNGTYTASYEVPSKGNYQLHIEVNGEPLGGSPFPLFFSAPVPQPAAPAAPAPGAAQPPAADAGAQQAAAATTALAGALAGIEAAALGALPVAPAAPQLDPKVKESLGYQLTQMGLRIPAKLSEEDVRCIVVVGNVPPTATSNTVESVFSKCGRIRSCTLVGLGSGFAFVEFSREKYAAAALEMKEPTLMGQPLKLELAADARKAGDATRAFQAQMNAPNLALQMAQRQQFELLQQQQAALAAQVAAMRAAQRAGAAPTLAPPQPHSNDSQKSAAIAAAIALAKKLAGGGAAPAAPAAANGDQKRSSPDRKRSRSRSRDRRRRSRSRSRDRSRDKRRRRSRSRERRSGRDRDSSRDRARRRSRSRSRDKHRHKHRHHKDRDHKERDHKDRDHKERRRRSRSRDRRERSEPEGTAGPDRMEVDAPAPAPAAAAQEKPAEQPADELEALLEELGD
ncbi:hypothetical protein ABPG77_008059 [Micractinium sp. CCAP 211/92]